MENSQTLGCIRIRAEGSSSIDIYDRKTNERPNILVDDSSRGFLIYRHKYSMAKKSRTKKKSLYTQALLDVSDFFINRSTYLQDHQKHIRGFNFKM